MTSTKPYLLRAFYDWIVDNHFTPYIAVNADFPGTLVPRQYVEGGKITLNISAAAVRNLVLNNETVHFSARFSGVLSQVIIPMKAVLAIYARENGGGMVFGEEENNGKDDKGGNPPPDKGGKPKLTIVK